MENKLFQDIFDTCYLAMNYLLKIHSEDKCPNAMAWDNITEGQPLGVLAVFPTYGNMWLTDIIERFTGRIITGSFMNVGDQSMHISIPQYMHIRLT